MAGVSAAATGRIGAEVAARLTGAPTQQDMMMALRQLAKWRCAVLEAEVAKRGPARLPQGPFAGMQYAVRASEGAWLPRLLGVYEASLAPVIETIIARAYPLVVDIGCAEGYYAVGLARRMPDSRIMARDGNPVARASCAQLAMANGVAAQVEIGGEMGPGDFALLVPGQVVIICDIEGAEAEVLNPETAPGLLAADLLVEVHEGMRPGTLDLLTQRFAATHHILRLDRKLDDAPLTGWMAQLNDLDRLLMLWEWRSSPTPWLWMERK